MLELGYQEKGEEHVVQVGYRIYISGDTLMGKSSVVRLTSSRVMILSLVPCDDS
jgi:hypothetical protein